MKFIARHRSPLPLAAAQYRHSELSATCRAATKRSGQFLRVLIAALTAASVWMTITVFAQQSPAPVTWTKTIRTCWMSWGSTLRGPGPAEASPLFYFVPVAFNCHTH